MSIFCEINQLSPTALLQFGVIEPAKTFANGYPTIKCPFCGNGSGNVGDGLTIQQNSKTGFYYFHCFGKCGKNYTVVDLLNERFGSVAAVAKWFENNFSVAEREKIQNAPMKEPVAKAELKDYTKFFKWTQGNLAKFLHERGGEYRGFSLEDLRIASAGITLPNEQDKNYWLVLPYSKHKFFKREVDGEGKKFIGGGKEIYNPFGAFDGKSAVFVVEGEIDCLSIYKAGFKAVAVGGVDNFSNLPEWLSALKLDYSPKIILLPDSDVVGKIQGKKGYKKMLAAGYDATLNFLSDEGIDANGMLTQRGVFALQKRLHEILKGEI